MTEEECKTALAKVMLNSPSSAHITLSAARVLIQDTVQAFKELGYIEKERHEDYCDKLTNDNAECIC